MPTLPLWLGMFASSHSMVSYVSELSSMSWSLSFFGLCGVMLTNWPSDMKRPRTSWRTKMNPSRSNSSLGPSERGKLSSPYGATL